MAEASADDQDQSMEEILQSIKRIIAEDGEEGENNDAKPSKASDDADPSDVLELVDVEEPSDSKEATTEPEPEEATQDIAAPEETETKAPTVSEEEIGDVESVIQAAVEEAASKPEPAPDANASMDVLDDIDNLLSDEAAKTASSALKSLADKTKPEPSTISSDPGMMMRCGNTVEDLVLEALRPMLKEWLDANLPATVERLVENEIKKISG